MPNKFECIIKPNEGKTYDISIWGSIKEYEDYDRLLETMNNINNKDEVNLYVSTSGGRCDIGFTLFDRIVALPCNVKVTVPYPTYSMGAILALSGNTLSINSGAFMMFHDYSTGADGKGNEIFKQTEAYMETFAYRFNSICQPFLTKKECGDILNGRDCYVKWNDNNLDKRIKRHFGDIK